MISMFSDYQIPDGTVVSKSGGGGGKDQSLKEVRTGQALNVVAAVGGANAMRMAVPEAKHAYKEYRGTASVFEGPSKKKWERAVGRKAVADKMRIPQGVRSVAAATNRASKSKKSLAILGAGAVGLHSGELLGDTIAARSMHSNAQRIKQTNMKRS